MSAYTVKPLDWCEPRQPDGKISFYDHCFAETPFGKYQIEWKGWKDNGDCYVLYGPGIDGPGHFISPCDSLDEAKRTAQSDLEEKLSVLIAPPLPTQPEGQTP
jgi:hypothetical protein